MAKNLLIVESPAKAKTIERILGEDFEVKSCYGHIRDLERADMGIDLNNKYKPRYFVPDDKLKVVKELKSLAKKSGEVWLATDEDREGKATLLRHRAPSALKLLFQRRIFPEKMLFFQQKGKNMQTNPELNLFSI